MKFPKLVLAGAAAVAAAVVMSVASHAQDAGPQPAKERDGRGRRGAMIERFRERGGRLGAFMKHRGARKARMSAFRDEMQVTDAQRQLFVEKARAAQPALEAARKDIAAAIVTARAAFAAEKAKLSSTTPAPDAAARKAAFEAIRAPVKAAREKAEAALAPFAKDLVAALSPEQRARMEGFAAGRGRKLDDARLQRAAMRMLRNPMALAIAEAELAK